VFVTQCVALLVVMHLLGLQLLDACSWLLLGIRVHSVQ
jgi:hypothetical protein